MVHPHAAPQRVLAAGPVGSAGMAQGASGRQGSAPPAPPRNPGPKPLETGHARLSRACSACPPQKPPACMGDLHPDWAAAGQADNPSFPLLVHAPTPQRGWMGARRSVAFCSGHKGPRWGAQRPAVPQRPAVRKTLAVPKRPGVGKRSAAAKRSAVGNTTRSSFSGLRRLPPPRGHGRCGRLVTGVRVQA